MFDRRSSRTAGRGPRLMLAAAATLVTVVAALASPSPIGPQAAQAATPGQPTTPIEHIVFVMKENRSFDGYFGLLPGVDGTDAATCWLKTGGTATIQPMPATPDPLPQDISHAASTFKTAYHNGKNDGFCHERGAIVTATGADIADTQMRESQIPNYWAYAQKYGIGDRMFASWKGASFANNVFEIAAQTGRYDTSIGRRAIYGNPKTPEPGPTYSWGCDDSAGTLVDMIALGGTLSQMYPCYDFPALPNVLDTYGVGWKWYANQGQPQFSHAGIDAIRSIRCSGGLATPCPQNPYWTSHVVKASALRADAQAGALPSVSWYLPKETEHPPKTACAGENASVRAINAIMKGPQWNSTAIVIVWDEWGGFHDHAVPPTAAGMNANISYGFRVPLLVISPWTKIGTLTNGGYVSSRFASHASLLRFVESAFGLPSLGAMDDLANYTATEPKPGDLMDFFDFSGATPPKGKLVLATRTCPTLSAAQKAYIASWNPD